MAISTQINNYQSLNTYQKPVTLPVQPERYTASEIYQASNGQTNVNNAQENRANEEMVETQADRDDSSATLLNYTAAQSKKSQVEIYLAVATDSQTSSNANNTVNILESLRDVQKQNNAVEAYATYQTNQNNLKSALF